MALEQRFRRLPDGSIWAQSPQGGLSFWRRYLDVFDHVRCLARVQDATTLPGDWHRANSGEVSFSAVPHYVGPWQYLWRAIQVRRAVHHAIGPGDAFVLRVPGNIGDLAWARLTTIRYPYAVEVIGDPYGVFAPGAVRHPLRAWLRWYAPRQLRRQCARACAASYVTAQVLQQRYPSTGPTIAASSVDLPDEAFAVRARDGSRRTDPANLIFVGSLEQYYKAPDVMIRAFAHALGRGLNGHLTIVGDGKLRGALHALAAASGCGPRVRFAGHLTPERVRAELDKADLFVLPSRVEGLPRAMIEAMARGVPCIGSDVGGLPELLPPEAMVPANDVLALADKMFEVLQDPLRMTQMSTRNLETATAYRSAVLQERRRGLYRHLMTATQRWLHEHGAGVGA